MTKFDQFGSIYFMNRKVLWIFEVNGGDWQAANWMAFKLTHFSEKGLLL
jgi:hypothetical protein